MGVSFIHATMQLGDKLVILQAPTRNGKEA